MTAPTTQQFTQYQRLYEYFNKELFKNELPFCLLILSRKTARVCGHFSKDRWTDRKGNKTHEINLNPIYMAQADDMDICQTLVHEMCHLWQYEFGKPSRAAYHNKEWANKMEEVGLTPSHTGHEGGRRTGQSMSDYPTPEGVFLKAFHAMPKELLLPFKSSERIKGIKYEGGALVSDGTQAQGNTSPTPPKKKNKIKYSCTCGNNVWGKPDLIIICGECNDPYQEQSETQGKGRKSDLLIDILAN